MTWSGGFRAPLDDQGVYPRSQQDPLPVWIGVGGTPQSAVRAGSLGLPMAIAIIGGTPERFGVLSKLHRRALADTGRDPSEAPLAVHAHGHIAASEEQAAEEFYPSYSAAMSRIGRERGWGPMTRGQFDMMRSPDGSLLLGTPEQVADKIVRWGDMLDLDRFMLHVSVGTMPHDQVMRSIELLGTEVREIVSERSAR